MGVSEAKELLVKTEEDERSAREALDVATAKRAELECRTSAASSDAEGARAAVRQTEQRLVSVRQLAARLQESGRALSVELHRRADAWETALVSKNFDALHDFRDATIEQVTVRVDPATPCRESKNKNLVCEPTPEGTRPSDEFRDMGEARCANELLGTDPVTTGRWAPPEEVVPVVCESLSDVEAPPAVRQPVARATGPYVGDPTVRGTEVCGQLSDDDDLLAAAHLPAREWPPQSLKLCASIPDLALAARYLPTVHCVTIVSSRCRRPAVQRSQLFITKVGTRFRRERCC